MRFLFVFLISALTLNAQQYSTLKKDSEENKSRSQFNSPEEIKLFADFLFCEKDFLRAAEEYQKVLNVSKNDTILFMQALSYSSIGDYETASKKFREVPLTSGRFINSQEELCKINFIEGDSLYSDTVETSSIKKLLAVSRLLNQPKLPTLDVISAPFSNAEKKTIIDFYNRKKDASYKSSFLAGVFSFIIPGAGKMYTGNISDGLISFAVNSLLGYITYRNFAAGHFERGYLFLGIGLMFQAGNIYGSVANANLYNAKLKENFNSDVKSYVDSAKYFIQDYGFCK